MKTQRTKTLGAAACALILCAAMVASLASLSTNDAHADGSAEDAVARTSATDNVFVGWYATANSAGTVRDESTGDEILVAPGSYGRDSTGGWVNLSQYGVWTSGGAAYIDEADLPALQSAFSFSGSAGAAEDGITWWRLYEVVEVPDPPAEEEKSPTKLEGDDTPNKPGEETPTPVPEAPKDPVPAPVDPVDPSPQLPVTGNEAPTAEPELFSLQCRESEAEAKIAELEAQGYEIVRVERLPKWFR